MTINNFTTLEIIDFKKADKVKVGDKLLSYFDRNKAIDPSNWYFYKPYVGGETEGPLFWVNNGWFLRVESINIEDYKHRVRIIETDPFYRSFSELLKRNSFSGVNAQLEGLGINQKLVNMIPVDHSYFGMIEICSCGIEDCYHRNAWIIRMEDQLIIPFLHHYSSPYEWIEFDVAKQRACYKPDEIHDWDDEETIADRKVIKNDDGDVIRWKGSEYEQDYPLLAFNEGFEIDPENLFFFDGKKFN